MNKKLWVVIPAAGAGKRMRLNHPKQYLDLLGKTVLEHTIASFSPDTPLTKKVAGIVVVISDGDEYWKNLSIDSDIAISVASGGVERCHSVLNGLKALQGKAAPNDWVMVHDAARPCLQREDIALLIKNLWQHGTGGLLGLRVADTLKYCGDNDRVKKTVSRDGLWRALTPQMFRYEKLTLALSHAIQFPDKITDEASAIEMAGYEPLMIEGRWDNIKITHPQDIEQADLILKSHEKSI